MDFWLGILQKEINELKTIENQIMSSGFENINNTEKDLRDINFLLRQNKNSKDIIEAYETMTPVLVDEGKGICDKAVKLQGKILELSEILNEGEAIINAKINQAKTRAANCQTSYQEAKEVLAVSKKAKEGAFNYYIDIKIHFEHIKKINAKLDLAYTNVKNYPFIVTDKEWYEKINNLLKPIPRYLDQLKLGLEKAKAFPNKKQNLKDKIENSKKFYIQSFPKHEAKFNRLISEVQSIESIYYVVDSTSLSELHDKYNNMEQAVLYASSNRETKQTYKFKHHSINCFPIKSSKEEMDNIEAVFFRELLVIKDNEFLSAGCVPTSEPMQEVAAEIPDIPDSGIDPPNIPTDTTATNTPDKSIFGGLSIGGPSEIIVGKGAQFIALDGIGDPFPNKGSFEWINTREGLMVLSRSGMTAHSLGFKPGKATIILKYEGMTAYKDINIVEKKKASLSTSNDDEIISTIGGEVNKDEEDTNYIGTTGGEVSGNNQLQEQCSELIDRITIFLNSFDIDAARDYTNRAVALGCNVNAGAVNALIAQIEDIKKAEQKEWEQQYANQNIQSRSDVERSQKRNQDLNKVMNLLGEQVIAISNSNDHIRQERRDRNNANFEKSQIRINDYFANTKKPPIIDPNHVSNTYKPPVLDDQYVSIESPSSGMSFAECDKKFCPVCYEGETQIDLFGVQVNRQCNKCRKENKTKIDDCINGGSAANSPDRNLSEFKNYTVYKCTWTWNNYGEIRHEIFYDYTGPEHTGKRKGECTNVSKGTAHECYWKASNLNSQYGTVNHLVLPR